MVQSHITSNIRAELARRGKNPKHLAEVLGITRQSVSQRLHGHVDFRVKELQAVADYLGIPVAALLDDHTKAAS